MIHSLKQKSLMIVVSVFQFSDRHWTTSCCGHGICTGCLTRWHQGTTNATCPLCRTSLKSNKTNVNHVLLQFCKTLFALPYNHRLIFKWIKREIEAENLKNNNTHQIWSLKNNIDAYKNKVQSIDVTPEMQQLYQERKIQYKQLCDIDKKFCLNSDLLERVFIPTMNDIHQDILNGFRN